MGPYLLDSRTGSINLRLTQEDVLKSVIIDRGQDEAAVHGPLQTQNRVVALRNKDFRIFVLLGRRDGVE